LVIAWLLLLLLGYCGEIMVLLSLLRLIDVSTVLAVVITTRLPRVLAAEVVCRYI
jgi:hypothetical protein